MKQLVRVIGMYADAAEAINSQSTPGFSRIVWLSELAHNPPATGRLFHQVI
jgi:hypothetical protein